MEMFTPQQLAVVLLVFILGLVLGMFLFAGGYQQFPPVLFLILLLLCMARLTPTRQ